MPVAIAPTPSDAPVGQQKKGSPDQMGPIPFARSSKWHTEQANNQTGIVINTPVPGTFNFPLPSYGYLSAVIITLNATGGSGVAAVYYEDAPWSIINNITLTDVNGVPIFQLPGYSAFLAAKFGGYRLFSNDISTTIYGPTTSSTTGAGMGAIGNNMLYMLGTSGNFAGTLPIFLEFGRDGLGSLPNMDASARYNLQIQLNTGTAAANVGPLYTTAPTGYPTLAIGVEVLCRSQPPAADLYGNANSITPPAVGTVNYWSQQTFSSLSGAQTLQLSRVGNSIRNHLLIFRDTAGATPTRAQAELADMPTLFQFNWDTGTRYVSYTSTTRAIQLMSTGYDVPKGVITFPNTLDPDKIAVSEFGDEWMTTVGATRLQLQFTPLSSVNLTVLTNDLVPASAAVYAAPQLSAGY
jgi:hypothetical protein